MSLKFPLAMLQIISLALLVSFSKEEYIDFRVVTAARNGLERSLNYIDKHLAIVNVDCLLGVSFAAALLKDAYMDRNHAHFMHRSSILMYQRAVNILQKAAAKYEKPTLKTNGENWKFQHLVASEIWFKKMSYKSKLLNQKKYVSLITTKKADHPNTDYCLQNIVNVSNIEEPTLCSIDKTCYSLYFDNPNGSKGYELTHRLLLQQFARQRKCIFENKWYENRSSKLCSAILSEVLTAEKLGKLDELFDVFMEEVFLCGYEGYTDFFQNRWLYYVLKSQKPDGCFSDNLTDSLKTRMKKDINYFRDGCNDHSTGVGTALLSLYYNFIVKEVPKNWLQDK